MGKRFPILQKMYSGPLSLDPNSLKVNYGSGKTIFIGHMTDLWAYGIKSEWLHAVLMHCKRYPGNTYVFQTKNPKRCHGMIFAMPPTFILGCTVETDIKNDRMGQTPDPLARLDAMMSLPRKVQTFITIEPIMKFSDPCSFATRIAMCKPDFVNIGADSKRNNLPEPTAVEVRELISELQTMGVRIREKHNLGRLLK